MKLSDDGKTLLEVDINDIKKDGTFNIPKGVTAIGKFAFYDHSGLQTLIKRLATIIGWSFYDSIELKSITVTSEVTSIGASAFWGCSGLQHITLPEGIISISFATFWDCSGLQSITLPKGVTSIGDFAFSYCSGLQSITLPEEVTSIGIMAFVECANLHSIMIVSEDDNSIQRITNLLPCHLKDKVISKDMTAMILQIRKTQLSRVALAPEINPLYRYFSLDARYTSKVTVENEIGESIEMDCNKLPSDIFQYMNRFLINENRYYQKAQVLMHLVPLPKSRNGLETYKNKLESIANECITKAKEFSKPMVSLSQKELKASLEAQLKAIARKEEDLKLRFHFKAANAVGKLHKKIMQSYRNTLPVNVVQFKKECKDAIDEARPHLENHRGLKLHLKYLAFTVTGLGALIVLADIGYKQVTGKHFSFFKTDTAQKLSALEKILDEVPDDSKIMNLLTN
ncbi:leucine-rich repeat domain-containing protein [Legionella clemsonensis]|uniref:Leucine Rich repeats (2 copies) n=1 Tax=Legionella clemsonensis TaxID=1867846 RepID=A0A222P543_9GAMM|nr:leucine-rich repeat domain-containing protein [Legionella clemsonensis]ASQ46937.1 hypothetical protein clem_12005 [Legionella clemsonensis]